jgi:hypothetical protein
MLIIDSPVTAPHSLPLYDAPVVLPVVKRKAISYQAILRREERNSPSVPLERLFEKTKNKRSKFLIGDLMQLSS